MRRPLQRPALPLPALAAALLLASCAPSGQMTRVDDVLLKSLPVERTEPVDIAVEQRSVAGDVHDNAQRLLAFAERAVTLATEELAVATRDVERGRVALERKSAEALSEEAARAARFEYEETLRTARIARLSLALAKREREVAALRATLALEEHRLADARVEYAKGFALAGLDLPAEAAVPMQDLEEQLAHHEREVRGATKRLSAARVDAQDAQLEYDSAVAMARLVSGR